MWNRIAPRLRRAIFTALEDAGQRGADEASIEDLLRAILRDTESAATFIVEFAGGDPKTVLKQIEPAGAAGSSGQRRERATHFSSSAMHVFDVAKGEAERLEQQHIGSEHILLALLRIGKSDASKALSSAGLTIDRVITGNRQWIRLRMPRRRGAITRVIAKARIPSAVKPVLSMPMLAWQVYVQKSLPHPAYWKNPYPLYHKLRRKDPVRRDPLAPVWVLTRYADIVAYLRDPRFKKDPFSSDVLPDRLRSQMELPDEQPQVGVMPAGPQSMLFLDPPRHTRIRGLFNKAFTPRTLQVLRPRIEQVATRMLDQVEERGGSMDLIRDLAYPLPTVVIAELLGFPPEDYERLKKWSDDFAATLSFSPTSEQQAAAARSREEMRQYFEQITERLRTKPEDNLISGLLAAEYEHSKLSKQELFANCVLLMAAGHETTTNLIGNGILALLQHPDQLKLLRTNPSLIDSAIDELLRYDSPVQWTSRVASENITIGGKEIARGEMVIGSLGAANRDPEQFPDPDRLDITRKDNRHIAFGAGIHFCLGAALAKMEGEIAISGLVQRFSKIELATKKLDWRRGAVFRGLHHLPLRVGR
jgi:cytochrome P450